MESWYIKLAQGEGLDLQEVLKALSEDIIHPPALGLDINFDEPLLSVADVAKLLNVSEKTVRNYAADRVISHVKIPGGCIRFERKQLLKELGRYERPSKFRERD